MSQAQAESDEQSFVVRSYGLTDPGRIRSSNQDSFVLADLSRVLTIQSTNLTGTKERYSSRQRGHIFLVADGMGGHAAGNVASAISVASVEAYLLNMLQRFIGLKPGDEATVFQDFQEAITRADARIFEQTAANPQMAGMGTTLTMALAVDWRLFIGHAGDTRCYLLHNGQLQQVTTDHTIAAEMIRKGALTPEEAKTFAYRNVVTNVLGGKERGVRVEVHQLDLSPGDILLLCSDGLTGMVADERILAILQEEPDPQRACERLVGEANEHGGKDNITVLVSRFSQ